MALFQGFYQLDVGLQLLFLMSELWWWSYETFFKEALEQEVGLGDKGVRRKFSNEDLHHFGKDLTLKWSQTTKKSTQNPEIPPKKHIMFGLIRGQVSRCPPPHSGAKP